VTSPCKAVSKSLINTEDTGNFILNNQAGLSTVMKCLHFQTIKHYSVYSRYLTHSWKMKQASHGLWSSAGLKMPLHAHFLAGDSDL